MIYIMRNLNPTYIYIYILDNIDRRHREWRRREWKDKTYNTKHYKMAYIYIYKQLFEFN